MTETNNLNDKWDLYYHLPTDSNWNLDSYHNVKTAQESALQESLLSNGRRLSRR